MGGTAPPRDVPSGIGLMDLLYAWIWHNIRCTNFQQEARRSSLHLRVHLSRMQAIKRPPINLWKPIWRVA